MQLVEAAYEEQVGHLFDDSKRVGKTACPEGFPHFIDLRFEFSGDHRNRARGTAPVQRTETFRVMEIRRLFLGVLKVSTLARGAAAC